MQQETSTIYDGKLMSYSQEQKIINQIQSKLNKNVINFQQIYLGTRDGLTGQNFWKKVNGKSNLLMILKSKSGHIFGGFSPCKWQYNLNKFVQDNTVSSFLFSQTHDEIYPLKEAHKAKAIYCENGYGPTFGEGYDMYIHAEFEYGMAILGNSYEFHKHQKAESSHLFGDGSPNIIECEIYQVIFG